MECVSEAAARKDRVSKPTMDFTYGREREIRREHQRPCGGRRDDRAIDILVPRRAAPRDISFPTVRRGNPPHVAAVPGKLACEAEAERSVCVRGGDGVFEPVDAGVAFGPATKVDPRV